MKFISSIQFFLILLFSAGALISQEETVSSPTAAPASQAASTQVAPVPQNEEGLYKHTRFGIRFTTSYNSFNVLSKTMTNESGFTKIGGGLLMETRLTKNVEFQTGIGVDVFGAKVTYSNDASGLENTFTNRYLYDATEEEIVKYKGEDRNKTGYSEYMLEQRTYKINYLTIPFNLRMKTNNIKGFKYFGQIGADFQIRWSAFVDDKARLVMDNTTTIPVELGESQELTKLKFNEDVSFMNVAINTGIGAQREIGGVDFFISFNYHFGLFSPVDKESEFTNKVYQTSPSTIEASKLKQDYRTRVFALTFGIMF